MLSLRRICTWNQWKIPSQANGSGLTFHRPTTCSAHAHLSKGRVRQYSTAPNTPCEVPPSKLKTKSHQLGWEKIQAQVEPYFSTNWNFASEKKKQGLLAIGLSRAFTNAFPLTLDNRIGVTCKMLYLSLLIDDQLEKMSFPQMLSYRHRTMEVVLGTSKPDISISREWMLYDTLEIMRGMNKTLANDAARGFCQLLKAMTSQERASISDLEAYLEFREVDVGRTFFTALMRFGANIHLTKAQLAQTKTLESTAFRHFSIINDIYSWEREWKLAQATSADGARPFSAVFILAKETNQPFSVCKESLYEYCRDLELGFKQALDGLRHDGSPELTPEMDKYVQSLEYFMSGMETWTQWTPRYQ
ncbi:hypothetical protein N7452_006415 [Penicillium brevicompactum]|uniref:Terpene synthase n=1 Tax=Penicillium brevicompactum TaxID=5074 RepID=A0A9W9QKI2_PENBR|nr:hypothetical protein N7452_006415 [Penicillium brevicompactum]